MERWTPEQEQIVIEQYPAWHEAMSKAGGAADGENVSDAEMTNLLGF